MGIAAVCWASLVIEGYATSKPFECMEPTLSDADRAKCFKDCPYDKNCAAAFRSTCLNEASKEAKKNCFKAFHDTLEQANQDLKTKADNCGVMFGETYKEPTFLKCIQLEESDRKEGEICVMRCVLDATCQMEIKDFCNGVKERKKCYLGYRRTVRETFKVLVKTTARCEASKAA